MVQFEYKSWKWRRVYKRVRSILKTRRLFIFTVFFNEEVHEDCRSENDDPEEHIDDPLDPDVWRDVVVVHSVVAALVYV